MFTPTLTVLFNIGIGLIIFIAGRWSKNQSHRNEILKINQEHARQMRFMKLDNAIKEKEFELNTKHSPLKKEDFNLRSK